MNSSMSENKRKTMMVLYKIEEEMGNYIIENKNALSIIDESFTDFKITDSLEKAYLDDIFQMVIRATKGTSDEENVKYLYKLSHELSLFEIRNSVAHPNRSFFDCYWYRVAAIASDPAFSSLGIKDIGATLFSAESGTIDDPPDGWDSAYMWAIKNNLPHSAESDITGLIGRNKDLKNLRSKISNPRSSVVAIVAPGGYGKTALAIDLLKNIVTSSSSSSWVDGVVYMTMKQEELTKDGIVQSTPSCSQDDITRTLSEYIGEIFNEDLDSLDQAISLFSEKRLLICVDNLETLLRDSPAIFEDFVETLPIQWKVLVTSRVGITNSYIYPLKELEEKAATHLGRLYNKNRGGDELKNEKYKQIARECYYNPLAIRLTLDVYISGHDIPVSINVAKNNISEFSYRNLVDSLSVTALKMLELIFIQKTVNRKSVCEILEISADEAAEGLNELARTSLISRYSGENEVEEYKINGSVKELLMTNIKNVEVRSSIISAIDKKKAIVQNIDFFHKNKNYPVWHLGFIPLDVNDTLKILLTDKNKAIRGTASTFRSSATELYSRFKESEELYSENLYFFRAFADIMSALKLNLKAEEYYKKAVSLDSENYVSLYALGRFYHASSNWDGALEVYSELMERVDAISNLENHEPFCMSIFQGYFLALISTGRFQRVIDETKGWKDRSKFRGVIGTFRATAFKRKIEVSVNEDIDGTMASLTSSVRIMNDVLITDGYVHAFCVQAYKIIEEIEFIFNRLVYVNKFQNFGLECLEFIDRHVLGVVEGHRKMSIIDLSPLLVKLKNLTIDDNPFSNSVKWLRYSNPLIVSGVDVDSVPENSTLAYIKNIATDFKGNRKKFLFAKDDRGDEYFVHLSAVENCEWDEWLKLREGYPLAILEYSEESGKDAYKAQKVLVVNT